MVCLGIGWFVFLWFSYSRIGLGWVSMIWLGIGCVGLVWFGKIRMNWVSLVSPGLGL